MSSGIVDEANDEGDKGSTDDLKESKIPLKVVDDDEAVLEYTNSQYQGFRRSFISTIGSSDGIKENVLVKTIKESLENLDSKNLSDNQTDDLKLDDTQEKEKESLFSTQ